MTRIKLFPAIIFALLAVNFTIVGITLVLAHSDRSFAVEPGYYQKAVQWDDTVRQREANASLGWTATVEPDGVHRIRVRLSDRHGTPIPDARVALIAFASSRASERFPADLSLTEPGLYTTELPQGSPGLWEFRVSATRGRDTFTHTTRFSLP